ncbi:MAG TPA: SprB repeat-containing protein, partial [Bacteroidia bacterium]|nr:SprB repeat-containing protein [Bacteroidia bacterium]
MRLPCFPLRFLLPLFVWMLPHDVQAQLCLSADAGPGDTVCAGQCTTLSSQISGTRSTATYSCSTTPYSPFAFTGGNPVLVNLDDLWSPVVSLPFCFEFYGTVYNQLIIGSNGVASFDISQANGNCPWTINTAAPNNGLPMSSIMAPFHDIDPALPVTSNATSINWNVYGTAPCRSFVINWNEVAMYGNGCGSLVSTSQAVLHETTNVIDIFIGNSSVCPAWNGGAAIEGIQNANGTLACVAPGRNYPAQWAAAFDGMRFSPAGAPGYTIQWLDPSGTVLGTAPTQAVCPTQTTTYTLNVVNTGCAGTLSLTDSTTVYVSNSPLAATYTAVYPNCFGNCNGSIDVTPTAGIGPFTYSWLPGGSTQPSVSNLCTGVYACTITDATGCSIVVAVNLQTPPPFTLTGQCTPTLCNASTGTAGVLVSGASGPYTYLWSTGDTTATLSNLAAGIYYVTVTDSAGCQDGITISVLMNGLQLASQLTPLLCDGDCNASLSVTPLNGIP